MARDGLPITPSGPLLTASSSTPNARSAAAPPIRGASRTRSRSRAAAPRGTPRPQDRGAPRQPQRPPASSCSAVEVVPAKCAHHVVAVRIVALGSHVELAEQGRGIASLLHDLGYPSHVGRDHGVRQLQRSKWCLEFATERIAGRVEHAARRGAGGHGPGVVRKVRPAVCNDARLGVDGAGGTLLYPQSSSWSMPVSSVRSTSTLGLFEAAAAGSGASITPQQSRRCWRTIYTSNKLDEVQGRLADLAGHHCLISNEQMLPAVHAMNRQGLATSPACV